MFSVFTDEYFMEQALKEAYKAYEKNEVPVGAVIVSDNRIISRAHNQVEELNDNTAHAEILALSAASEFLGSKYLNNCSLFVTLEPCLMCAGALFWTRINKLVYGAADDKRGFMRYGKEVLHPRTNLEYGILESECKHIIKSFFQQRRAIN